MAYLPHAPSQLFWPKNADFAIFMQALTSRPKWETLRWHEHIERLDGCNMLYQVMHYSLGQWLYTENLHFETLA